MPKKSKLKKSKKDEDEITEIAPEEDKIDNDVYEETEIDGEDEVDDNVEDNVEDNGEDDGEDDGEDLEDDEVLYDEDGQECHLDKIVNEDNEYFENEDEIEVQPDTTVEYVKKEERHSSAKLTKYEMVRILGERTKQLTMGAKPMIKNYKNLPYDKIAEEELKLNMIPFKIRRPLPNGKFELWTLEELNKNHLLSLLD